MTYFKIATGKFIQYDEATNQALVVIKADLLAQEAELRARIDMADPNQPKTNAEWLVWAKEHYPYVDHSAEIAEVVKINSILLAIKAL
jgi:hypothetical protein